MVSYVEQDVQVKEILDILQQDPTEALQRAETFLRNVKADVIQEAKGKVALSRVYLQKGDERRALQEATDALNKFESAKDYRGQCDALRCIILAHLYEENTHDAGKKVSDALERFKASGEIYGEAAMLLLQADVFVAEGEYDKAVEFVAKVRDVAKKIQSKDNGKGYLLIKVAEFYLAAWKPPEASQVCEEATGFFRQLEGAVGKHGEAVALHASAQASQAEEKYDEALKRVVDATEIFQASKELVALAAVVRTRIGILLAKGLENEAINAASDAVSVCHTAGDVRSEASAKLQLAEVCAQTSRWPAAKAAAKEALQIFKDMGSIDGQSAALSAIAVVDFESDGGDAIWASEEKIALYQGNAEKESEALLALANVFVARIGRKIARCSLASSHDTIAAIKAAKDAYAACRRIGDSAGMESAMRVVSQALLYNNVSPDAIESVTDPDQVYQDVQAGAYGNAKNALPRAELQTNKNLKIDDVIPSSKQLDRGKFAWNQPLASYSYALIWQSTTERTVKNRRPRDSYRISTLLSGSKLQATPALVNFRSNDAADRANSLVVYMLGTDCKQSYSATMMSVMNVLAGMIAARVPRITFVQFDESHFDWTDTKVRECNFHPVVLGIIRSCRIEAPHVTIGFVGGDAASWMSNPAPLIESIFDTVECDESEVVYKKGDAFAPLLVHRQMDENVLYVKPNGVAKNSMPTKTK